MIKLRPGLSLTLRFTLTKVGVFLGCRNFCNKQGDV